MFKNLLSHVQDIKNDLPNLKAHMGEIKESTQAVVSAVKALCPCLEALVKELKLISGSEAVAPEAPKEEEKAPQA